MLGIRSGKFWRQVRWGQRIGEGICVADSHLLRSDMRLLRSESNARDRRGMAKAFVIANRRLAICQRFPSFNGTTLHIRRRKKLRGDFDLNRNRICGNGSRFITENGTKKLNGNHAEPQDSNPPFSYPPSQMKRNTTHRLRRKIFPELFRLVVGEAQCQINTSKHSPNLSTNRGTQRYSHATWKAMSQRPYRLR